MGYLLFVLDAIVPIQSFHYPQNQKFLEECVLNLYFVIRNYVDVSLYDTIRDAFSDSRSISFLSILKIANIIPKEFFTILRALHSL